MRFLRLTATSIRKPSGDLCAPGDSGWQNAVGWFFDGDEGVRDEINVTQYVFGIINQSCILIPLQQRR